MNETQSNQSSVIAELQTRNNLLEHELLQLRNPTHEQVFAYIDRQVTSVGIVHLTCLTIYTYSITTLYK